MEIGLDEKSNDKKAVSFSAETLKNLYKIN